MQPGATLVPDVSLLAQEAEKGVETVLRRQG